MADFDKTGRFQLLTRPMRQTSGYYLQIGSQRQSSRSGILRQRMQANSLKPIESSISNTTQTNVTKWSYESILKKSPVRLNCKPLIRHKRVESAPKIEQYGQPEKATPYLFKVNKNKQLFETTFSDNRSTSTRDLKRNEFDDQTIYHSRQMIKHKSFLQCKPQLTIIDKIFTKRH